VTWCWLYLWTDNSVDGGDVLYGRILLRARELVASVLDDRVLRADLKAMIQERRVDGRVLDTILEVVVYEGRLKGKILEGRRRLRVTVSMRIERSLLGCALDKLCKGSRLIELIPRLIEV